MGLYKFHKKRKLFAFGSNLINPPKGGLSLPYSLAKKRIYLDTHLKEKITDLFQKLSDAIYYHRQNREKMMRAFIIDKITFYSFLKDSTFLPFQLSQEENILGDSLDSYQDLPFSHKQSRKRMGNTLIMA